MTGVWVGDKQGGSRWWCETGVYYVHLALQCIYGLSDEGGEDRDGEEGKEWRLPGLLNADDLVCVGRW